MPTANSPFSPDDEGTLTLGATLPEEIGVEDPSALSVEIFSGGIRILEDGDEVAVIPIDDLSRLDVEIDMEMFGEDHRLSDAVPETGTTGSTDYARQPVDRRDGSSDTRDPLTDHPPTGHRDAF